MKISQLKRYLNAFLPDYMVPSTYIRLERIPFTTGGKVDYKKLPETNSFEGTGVEYMAPQTALEKITANIWKKVLHLDRVGINQNFFSLGGNSMQIIEVNHLLKMTLERDIPMVDMFKYATINTFAAYLQRNENNDPSPGHDREEILNMGKEVQKQRWQKRRRIKNEF